MGHNSALADPEDCARGGEGGLGVVPPAGVQRAEPPPLQKLEY